MCANAWLEKISFQIRKVLCKRQWWQSVYWRKKILSVPTNLLLHRYWASNASNRFWLKKYAVICGMLYEIPLEYDCRSFSATNWRINSSKKIRKILENFLNRYLPHANSCRPYHTIVTDIRRLWRACVRAHTLTYIEHVRHLTPDVETKPHVTTSDHSHPRNPIRIVNKSGERKIISPMCEKSVMLKKAERKKTLCLRDIKWLFGESCKICKSTTIASVVVLTVVSIPYISD